MTIIGLVLENGRVEAFVAPGATNTENIPLYNIFHRRDIAEISLFFFKQFMLVYSTLALVFEIIAL